MDSHASRMCSLIGASFLLAVACVSPEGTLEVDADRAVDARRDAALDSPADGGPLAACNTVTFRLSSASARSVWVSGSFLPRVSDRWPATPAEGAIELAESGDVFEGSVTIPTAGRHLYKLIVDGTVWIADPTSVETEPDGFGGQNSVLYVCSSACGDLEGADWRDTVMYFALVDRFRDSDGRSMPVAGSTERGVTTAQYVGGDLAGLRERIPYLADLGVTALWLSAPYENRELAGAAIDPGSDPNLYSAYHGYWPSPENISYADPRAPSPRPRVEARIGTSDDLRGVVDTLHATTGADGQPMRVLFDYVMKHVDAESGLHRAHPEWFVSPVTPCAPDRWNDSYWGTRCSFTSYLPSFDFYRTDALEWSVRDATWWAAEYRIDGFRLDAVKHIPTTWLTSLRDRLDASVRPPSGGRFYMVGETFDYFDAATLRRYVDPPEMLDGQFDFPLKRVLCEAVFRPEGSLVNLASFMDANDTFYGRDALMTTWIGNHDIPRAIHFASGQLTSCTEGSHAGNGWNAGAFTQPTEDAPYERLGVAFGVLMTNPGIPLVYYGDELGLAGGGDPDNRRAMPWEDRGAALLPPQVRLRTLVRRLARLRGEHPVLGRGRRQTLSVDGTTWVFRRFGCEPDDGLVVVIHRGEAARTVSLPEGTYREFITEADVEGASLVIPARSVRILARR